jgi:hypothetical protein
MHPCHASTSDYAQDLHVPHTHGLPVAVAFALHRARRPFVPFIIYTSVCFSSSVPHRVVVGWDIQCVATALSVVQCEVCLQFWGYHLQAGMSAYPGRNNKLSALNGLNLSFRGSKECLGSA